MECPFVKTTFGRVYVPEVFTDSRAVVDTGLCCVTFFERYLNPSCVDSAQALWASFDDDDDDDEVLLNVLRCQMTY